MAKRSGKSSKPDPFTLIQELHAQLKECDPLPPPWDAYQTDNPKGHHKLPERLQAALKIPSLGPSRHMVTSADGTKEEFFPDRIWTMKVMPSFRNYGLVAVFEGRSKVRGSVICKGDLPDKPDADYTVVDQILNANDWSDSVLPIIQSLNIAPTPDRTLPDGNFMSALDGTSYSFQVETHDVATAIRFSNPKDGPYKKLAMACCDAATLIAKMANHPQVSSFVNSWRSSLHG